MSWVRWGSRCHQGYPFREDTACDPAACPGSDVYVYDSGDGVVCCECSLREAVDGWSGDHVALNEAAMVEHLKEHIAAGHHVPRSLLLVTS